VSNLYHPPTAKIQGPASSHSTLGFITFRRSSITILVIAVFNAVLVFAATAGTKNVSIWAKLGAGGPVTATLTVRDDRGGTTTTQTTIVGLPADPKEDR